MKNKIVKTHTDLSQSKKLAEILPLESADMCYSNDGTSIKIDANPYNVRKLMWKDYVVEVIPCWSLAALFNLCPTINGKQPILTRGKITRLWYCYYEDEMDTQTYDNPVDAVFEMIIKLHEQKLL